jgi:hypothetical protein
VAESLVIIQALAAGWSALLASRVECTKVGVEMFSESVPGCP